MTISCTEGSLKILFHSGVRKQREVAGFSKHHGILQSMQSCIRRMLNRISVLPMRRLSASCAEIGWRGRGFPHGNSRLRISFVRLRAREKEVQGVPKHTPLTLPLFKARRSRRSTPRASKLNSSPHWVSQMRLLNPSPFKERVTPPGTSKKIKEVRALLR